MPPATRGSPLATEDFGSAPGSEWTQYGPNMWSASGGELAAWGPGFAFAGYTDVTWPNDQWGKITMRNATAGEDYCSIDLRLSDAANDGDGYSCYTDGNNEMAISRWDNGSSTDLQVMGSNPGDNDDFSLEVEGTTLRAYINGVQEGTDETDSTYSSGDAGCGAHYGGTGVADDWEGGGFVAAAPFPPFKPHVNTLLRM